MSAFALSGLAVAMRKLNMAISTVETFCDVYEGTPPLRSTLIAEAYADMLQVRGELGAVVQLIELECEMGAADTERPSAVRLVGK